MRQVDTLTLAIELWYEGLSLTDIGRACGVSRQRIHQLIEERPDLFEERDWVTPHAVGIMYGISANRIRRAVEAGDVRQSPSGLVSIEDVETVIAALLNRPCQYPNCTNVLDTLHARQRFCTECSQEAQRYRYPVMDEEERKRTREAMKRWKTKNPERWAAIQQRAGRRYRERLRAESPQS